MNMCAHCIKNKIRHDLQCIHDENIKWFFLKLLHLGGKTIIEPSKCDHKSYLPFRHRHTNPHFLIDLCKFSNREGVLLMSSPSTRLFPSFSQYLEFMFEYLMKCGTLTSSNNSDPLWAGMRKYGRMHQCLVVSFDSKTR